MGLDMYLKAEKYVSGSEFDKPASQEEYKGLLKLLRLENLASDTPTALVNVNVAYWRKANQIHKWFVDNVQDGVDECQTSYVKREQLEELVELCEEAYMERDSSILPSQDGFFFGSTADDEWYWKDIKDTIDTLNGILANPVFKEGHWSFYYRSSW